MAVAQYWTGDATDPDHWRDMMFRVTGAPVSLLKKTFTTLWEVASGEVLVPQKKSLQSSPSMRGALPLQTLSLTNLSPDQDTEELSTTISLSIAAATKSVIIVTPYMVLEKRVEQSLIEAADRGVDVRLLLPGPVIDSKIVQSASQYYYERLLSHGIRIYEYQPTMLHSKYMVIDGTWSIIGSANMDTRSTFFNVENILSIQQAELATDLTKTFEQGLTKAKEITQEEW